MAIHRMLFRTRNDMTPPNGLTENSMWKGNRHTHHYIW
jgi:hypothetical protein